MLAMVLKFWIFTNSVHGRMFCRICLMSSPMLGILVVNLPNERQTMSETQFTKIGTKKTVYVVKLNFSACGMSDMLPLISPISTLTFILLESVSRPNYSQQIRHREFRFAFVSTELLLLSVRLSILSTPFVSMQRSSVKCVCRMRWFTSFNTISWFRYWTSQWMAGVRCFSFWILNDSNGIGWKVVFLEFHPPKSGRVFSGSFWGVKFKDFHEPLWL